MSVVVVLIGGGHRAGKRTVCDEIQTHLKAAVPDLTTHIIELDEWLKPGCEQNVRGPLRFDFDRVRAQISQLGEKKTLVLIPGLYALYDRDLRNSSSMKVFVDCDADTRLNRWITQDVLEKGQELKPILDTYLKNARPEFNEFIQPTKEFADVVLPSEESRLGISLICDGLLPLINEKVHKKQTLSPRFPGNETDLDVERERYDEEKNQYYDLS